MSELAERGGVNGARAACVAVVVGGTAFRAGDAEVASCVRFLFVASLGDFSFAAANPSRSDCFVRVGVGAAGGCGSEPGETVEVDEDADVAETVAAVVATVVASL